jgi:hypothetical protein
MGWNKNLGFSPRRVKNKDIYLNIITTVEIHLVVYNGFRL